MLREAPCRQQRSRTRICLWCGYGGRELQRQRLVDYSCPSCGGDLYARPPRSYAEMEGLDEPPMCDKPPSPLQDGQPIGTKGRLIDRFARWAVVSFILVLLLIIAAQGLMLMS